MCVIEKKSIDGVRKRICRDCNILLGVAVILILLGIALFFFRDLKKILFPGKEDAIFSIAFSVLCFGLYVFYITPIRRRVKLAKHDELQQEFQTYDHTGENKDVCNLYYELLGTSMLTILMPIKDFFKSS